MPTVSQLSEIVASLPSIPKRVVDVESTWTYLVSLFRRNKRPPRKLSPYGRLKVGEKLLVVAIIENGTSTFMKFGPAAFEEHPWV
jgi:hypothetical protein